MVPGFLKDLVTPNVQLAVKVTYVRKAECITQQGDAVVYKENGRNE